MVSAESRRNSAKTNGVGWQNRAHLGSTAHYRWVKDCDRLLHFFTRFDPALTALTLPAEPSITDQIDRKSRKNVPDDASRGAIHGTTT
jgi:hypothetical protein